MENVDWTSQVACLKPIHLLIFFSLAYWKESYQRMSKYLLLIKFLLIYLSLLLMVRNIHIALPLYNFLNIKLCLCGSEFDIVNVILSNGNSSLLTELEKNKSCFLLIAHNSWFLVKSNILHVISFNEVNVLSMLLLENWPFLGMIASFSNLIAVDG